MKAVILIPYFGHLPKYFELFLKSVADNREFQFIMFTNNVINLPPPNMKVIDCQIADIRNRIHQTLDSNFKLNNPYKLCDYKPTYGVIFNDYIKDFDWWGYCDVDLIFGNLYKHIGLPLNSREYDVIYNHGHLCLYRNTDRVNNAFKYSFSGIEYRYVFSRNSNFGFDEKRGINQILKEHGYSVYTKNDFIDTAPPAISSQLIALNQINYSGQKFIWENGSIYRIYGTVKEEFSYIHLQKRLLTLSINICAKNSRIYINPFEFSDISNNDCSCYNILEKAHAKLKEYIQSCRYKYHLLINFILYGKKPTKRLY